MKTHVVLIIAALLFSCSEDDAKKQVTYDSILGVWKYSDPNGKFSTEFELYNVIGDDYNIRNIKFFIDGVEQPIHPSDDYVSDEDGAEFIADISVVAEDFTFMEFNNNTPSADFTLLNSELLIFSDHGSEEEFDDVQLTR